MMGRRVSLNAVDPCWTSDNGNFPSVSGDRMGAH